MIKACIFDLDGVIVDTAKYHYQAWRRIAEYLGFDFTEAQNEMLKGISRVDSLLKLAEIGNINLNRKQVAKYCHTKNNFYLEYIEYMDEQEILPGVEDFIKELKENDIRVAIGSASKNARKILDKIGLTPVFDVIVDGNAVARSKPDPEVFTSAASLMGVFPSECIVFEDSFKGIEAAKSGGFYAIGIGASEVLTNADLCIDSFIDMDLARFYDLLPLKTA